MSSVSDRLKRLLAVDTVPPAYRRACRLLDVTTDPATLLGAGYTVGAAGSLLGLALTMVRSGAVATVGGVGFVVAAAGVGAVCRYGVVLAAQAKRIRSLGTAPSLVVTLVLGMALWPTAERAAAFTATAGRGLLTESLNAHRHRARGSPHSGLQAFASEWGEQFPALKRSIGRIERAAVAPVEDREAILAAARRQILDGTRDEMAQFAANLRGPATALYAFGVLLPLAMIALLPAAAAAGVPVTPSLLVVTYGILLPAGLVVASAWLLAQRPVAFPPATIPRSHPEVPSSRLPAVASGVFGAILGWFVGGLTVPGWGPPIAALGAGSGLALVVHYRPVAVVRNHVDAVEAGLPDLLAAVGRRVDHGQSVEAALDEAVGVTPDPLSSVLDRTLDRQRTLGIGVEAAFRGDHGTTETVPSPRLGRAATMLGVAADIGPPAGETITTMGDHLDSLAAVERETRRDLAQITGTLSNTATLFGPLVGGATVSLAGTMDGGSGSLGTVQTAAVGPVVGWYCLVLAAVLTALSTGLHRGLDRALVGYRVGLALCSATATYFAAAVATGILV